MTERPIIFPAPMVRALLAGDKTQTRRVIKPQPRNWAERVFLGPFVDDTGSYGLERDWLQACECDPVGSHKLCSLGHCPYGVPGDRLWVRESGWQKGRFFSFSATPGAFRCEDDHRGGWSVAEDDPLPSSESLRRDGWKRTPSIHMPRWASRITLELTEVRPQRLHDITLDDVLAEGTLHACCIARDTPGATSMSLDLYRTIWDDINKKRGHGWDANDWVWALTFQRLEASHA